MKPDVQVDYQWSFKFYQEADEILSEFVGKTGTPRPSSPERDMHECSDYELNVGGQDVMIRTRRRGFFKRFGDFTIRSWRASQVPTELDKIRDGHGDYYLYLSNVYDRSIYYCLWSANDVRDAGIFDMDWPQIINRDRQTGFITIPYDVIEPFIMREGYWPKKAT